MSNLYLSEKIESPHSQPQQPEVIHNPHYQEFLKLSKKQWMFSDLLPMDKEKTILCDNKQKIKLLNILKHLYQTAADALHAFYIDRRVDLFDAHVGESACQLRAVKLAYMLKKINIKISTEVLGIYDRCNQKMKISEDLIVSYKNTHKKIDGNLPLVEFLKQYDLDCRFDLDMIFLVSCSILSLYKKNINLSKDIIRYDCFKKDWSLSNSLVYKVITNTQRLASFSSVHFMFLNYIGNPDDLLLLSYQLKKDDSRRWVLPCLAISEYLLRFTIKYDLPYIIDILLEFNGKLINSYKLISIDGVIGDYEEYKGTKYVSSPYPMPMIYIQGFSTKSAHNKTQDLMVKHLNTYGIDFIIRANTASHNQYIAESLKSIAQNPNAGLDRYFSRSWLDKKTQYLRDLQAASLIYGLCNFRPDTFAISHIACTTQSLI